MRKNIILLLATVLLLFQSSLAFRIPRRICSLPSEGEEDISRKRLLIYAEQEYSKVAEYIVEESTKIYQEIIDEATTNPDSELKPHIDKLSEFVERVKNMENMPAESRMKELIMLSNQSMILLGKYISVWLQNPPNDILRMEKLLEKYGTQEFSVQALRRIHKFSDGFRTKVEENIASLPPEKEQTEDEFAIRRAKKFGVIAEFFALIQLCIN